MAKAESSKRLSRQILVQAAMLAVAGLSASRAQAVATDNWIGPVTDNANTDPTNWANASSWMISNAAAGQVIPIGLTAGTTGTDILNVNENDANAYQINYDNTSLAGGVNDFDFGALTVGNAGVGSVNFNMLNGAEIGVTSLNFTSNATLDVGTDGGSNGGIFSGGAATFRNNSTWTIATSANASASTITIGTSSTLNVLSGSIFTTTAGATFTGASLATQAALNISGSTVNIGSADSDFGIGVSGYATANIDSSSTLNSTSLESATASDFFGGLKIGESTGTAATASGGVLNTAGTVNVTGRLDIGIISANSGGTGAAATLGSTGLVSMTGGTWTNNGNVLIGMDASSAGNGTATGAVPAFGLAHGELDISGGTFTVGTLTNGVSNGAQVYVGASSATGVLNVSGGTLSGPSSTPLAGIQVGTTFNFLANTEGAGANGADGSIPGTGTFIVTGSGAVNTASLSVGAGSTATVYPGGTLTLTSLIVGAGLSANLSGGTVNFVSFGNIAPSITLNGGSISVSGNNSNVTLDINASTNFTGIAGGGTQQFGSANFTGGDSTVQATYGGSGTDVLSFTGISRAVGAAGNFVYSGGTIGVNNSIALAGQATGFINQGIFVGGSNYAWYDAGGFVRGIEYGSDPGAVTSSGGASVLGTYIQTTGAITAEPSTAFTTLAITGAYNFGLAGGATITGVSGIDKSGTGTSIISGGAGIQIANNAELVIRSNAATDNLTISSNILADGTNVLTKVGAGTLTLSGSNTYTGGTIITDGTLVYGSSTGLPSTGSITINPLGTLDLNSQTATIGGLTLNGGGFLDTGGGGALSLNGDVVSLTSPSTFPGALTLTPPTAVGAVVRTFNVSGNNAVSDLTLSGVISAGGANPVTLLKTGPGTLTLSGANSASSFNTLEVTQGTLRIDGSTGTLTDGLVNLTFGSSAGTSAGTFKYDNTTSTGARTNAMAALTFASGDGTVESVQTAAQNVALTFSSLSRDPGATGDFIVSGGTNGTTNKISITGQPTGFMGEGYYYNSSNFAYYDPSGYVRGISYGTDPGTASIATNTTGISPTAASNLQITGLVSVQSTYTTGVMLNSLVLNGGAATGLEISNHSVIQMINSVIKTGGGSNIQNQGELSTSGTQTTLTPNADLIYRTDTAADILVISYSIQGNGVNNLVKSGPGVFVIGNDDFNYTGDTIIDGGILTFNGTTTDASDINSSTLDYNNFGGVISFNTEEFLTIGGLTGSQSLPPLVTAPITSITTFVGGAIAPVTLTVGSALDNQSNTYSGVLSGPGNIVKAGTGTWTLTAAETYTGTTNISNGALQLTSTASLASTKLFLGSNVSLIMEAGQGGANFSLGTILGPSAASSISASGITGTLALGAITRNPGSSIDFGVLPTGAGSINTSTANTAGTILGAWATVNQTGWATVAGNGTIGALASYSPTFSSGADVDAPTGNSVPGTLSINSLRLNNSGSYTIADSGAGDTLTDTSGGILETAGVGANPATISVANLTSAAPALELIVDQSNTAAPLTISSNITGAIALTKTGAGTLVLSGTSTYTGLTTISDGTLAITSDAAVNGGIGKFAFSNGTLQFNNYTSNLNFASLPLRLGAASGASSTLTGTINGSSGLNYVGPGTLILSGDNTYTGATTINAGTLQAGLTTALSNTSSVTLANVAGATLNLNGFNNTIESLIGGGANGGNIILGGATLSVGGDETSASYGNSPVYAGVISGTGGLTKVIAGGGTYNLGCCTLTGVNTYTGLTTLAGGVLAITADTAVNNGAGGFAFTGGTLQFNGYTSNLSFNNLATLNLGAAEGLVNSTLTGAITGTSKLTFSGPGTLTLAPSPATANTYTGGTLLADGTLAISADSAINSGAGGITFTTGTLQFDNYTSNLSFAGVANLKLGAATGAASQLAGTISGTSALLFAGPGTLQLTSTSNNYSSGTTVLGGTLQPVSNATTLGSTTGALAVDPGGILDLNGTNQTVNALNGIVGTGFILNNDTGTNSTLTIGNGNTAGTYGGEIINDKSGTGTVALTKVGTAAETLSGTGSTYTGITNVSAGTLAGSAAGAFSPNSEVLMANVAGATLNNDNVADTIGSLTGGGATGGNVNLGTGVLSIGNDNTSPGAYAGVISSTSTAGGITKIGTGTLTLSGVNTYTGPTLVSNGTLEIAPTGSLAGATNVTINATSTPAAMKVDDRSATGIVPVTYASLNLVAGGTLTMASTSNHANRMQLVTSSLSNAGNIDLGNNDMIIHNSSPAAAATTLAAVTGDLASGFDGGTWAGNSNGSIRSSVAASNTTHLTALGSADGLTSFDGGTFLATDVLVKYTYYGDANLSGNVDASDYSLIDNGFLNNLTGWYNGDFNYDGVVNGSDYTLIDNAFNMQGASLASVIASPDAAPTSQIAGASGASSVPEPTSMALLGIATAGLLGRRRRCH